MYAKDTYEAKYQFLINKGKCIELKHFKGFIEYSNGSNDMEDVYKNIEEYNIGKKRKRLVFFDDMIAIMINNKKLNSVVTKLFIRGRKLNIFLLFKVPKDVRLNSTDFFFMKFQIKKNFNKLH